MNPLDGCCPCLKFCFKNASGIATWVGVAISVAGIACSFFAGLSLMYAAAFAILGIITLLGTCWRRQCVLINRELREEVGNLREINLSLAERTEELKEINVSLTQKTEKLEKIETSLTKTNLSLVKTNEELQKNNLFLAKTNIELAAEIEKLKKTSETIKQQLILLKYETSQLEATRAGFDEFGRKLDRSLLGIDEEIRESHSLCVEIKKVLNSQENDISQGISKLTGLLEDLKESSSLHEKMKALSVLSKELETAAKELNASKLEANKVRLLIDILKQEHQKSMTELQEVSREVKENTEKLSKVRNEIEINAQRLLNATEGAISSLATKNSTTKQHVVSVFKDCDHEAI
jgi:chromosome segregation ATPase